MSDRYKVEKVFDVHGFDCVVTLNSMGFRCGYVGVKKSSPLYGVDYGEDLKNEELLDGLKDAEIGKRGVVPVLCWDGEKVSPDLLFNVHGGLTYSAGNDYPVKKEDTWWFGFDCGHCDDAKDWEALKQNFPKERWETVYEIELKYPTGGTIRTKEYVMQECKSLVEQIIAVESVLKTDIQSD